MRRALLGFLLLASLTAGAQSNAPFTLICQYAKPEGGNQDATFYVNPGSSTVNEYPATITDDEISWKIDTGKFISETNINRYTGKITFVGIEEPSGRRGPVISGTCTRATERKF